MCPLGSFLQVKWVLLRNCIKYKTEMVKAPDGQEEKAVAFFSLKEGRSWSWEQTDSAHLLTLLLVFLGAISIFRRVNCI